MKKKYQYCKSYIYEINEFANRCGYFTGNTNVNYGYGCNHPDQDIKEYCHIGKKQQGKCYSWNCPLGININNNYDYIKPYASKK